jgi:large repetitive protein
MLAITAAAVPSDATAAPTGPGTLQVEPSNPPVFSWATDPSAAKYEIVVDNGSGFSSPLFSQTTVGTVWVPKTLMSAGDYYWRVRSLDQSNASSPWTEGSLFTLAPTSAPTDLAPDNNEILHQPDQPVRLSWAPVQGASSYTVEVHTNDGWVGASSYTTQVPSLVVPKALAAGSYYWRVKALRATGIESAYSDAARFAISNLDAPSGLNNIGHDGGTIVDQANVQDVILDWQPVPGAKAYDLQVSKDDDFSESERVDSQTGLVATRYSPSVTYDNSAYYWRVRAVDASGNPSDWSANQSFTRQWPDRPSIVHPAPAASPPVVNDPLHLEWTPVPHASHYEVQMGSDPNFSPDTYNQCTTNLTTYSPGNFGLNHDTGTVSLSKHEECRPAVGTVTYWRVRPLDAPFTSIGSTGVQGLYSATAAFIYRTEDDRLGEVSPAHGETVDIPVLRWDPVLNADAYRVVVTNAAGSTVDSATTEATSFVPAPTTPLKPEDGPFTWTLTGLDPAGRPLTRALSGLTFNVSGAIPSTGAPQLTALTGRPEDPATHRAPLLSWEPVAGTNISYRVDAGPHGTGTWFTPVSGDMLNKKVVYPAVTDTHTWFLTPGKYDWRVRAFDGTTLVATGPVSTFEVAELTNVTGQQMAIRGAELGPASPCGLPPTPCGEVSATPVFDWEPVAGASMYALYLARDDKFTNRLEPLNSLPATTNSRWAPTWAELASALPDNEIGESYYLHVRPCKSPKVCSANPISATGQAQVQFTKRSPAVSLERPAPGASVTTAQVTFDWEDYWAANNAPGAPQPVPQSGQRYRIQIDDQPSFGSPLETAIVDQSSYTSKTLLYPEGTLHWRVQAIDGDNNDLTWSPGRSFTKATSPVTLVSPLGDTSPLSQSPEFKWEPRAFAASYDIELYRNNDTALSSGNRVFTKKVTSTSYVWNKPLPPDGSPYLWRVRANDVKGNSGPWTSATAGALDSSRFTVGREAPDLTAPASNASLLANKLLLRWSPVAGAVSYKVDVRPQGSTTAVDSTTTRARAYAPSPTRFLEAGQWSWQVVALDSDGNELGVSPTRAFSVVAVNLPMTSTSAPVISGTAAVGQTLRVSAGRWSVSSPSVGRQWLRNGRPIPGATGSSYQLTASDALASISARVTASKSGYSSASATSDAKVVAKATSKTSFTASPTTLRRGKQVTVKVLVRATGITPTGRIRVTAKAGKRTVAKSTSLRAGGRTTVKLKLKKAGGYKVRVVYVGTTAIAGSKSAKRTVKVVR